MSHTKKAGIPRHWRIAAKQVTKSGVYDDDTKNISVVTYSDIASDMNPSAARSYGAVKASKPGETGEQTNIHARPVMKLVDEFNNVSNDIQNAMAFTAADIDYIMGVASDIYPELDEGELEPVEECVGYLLELHDMLYSSGTFEEQYELWFHALNSLKMITDIARYVIVLPSPDEMADIDEELLPNEVLGQVPGQVTDLYPYDGVAGDTIEEYMGIDIESDPYTDDNSYRYKPEIYGTLDSASKTLSIRQLMAAFEKAYNVIMSANGGYVYANPMFTGLNLQEIDALVAEGWVKRQGNRITLTRAGFDRGHGNIAGG